MTKTPESAGAFTAKPSKIKPCTCKHSYQDARYGQGNRVMNPMKGNAYRCTVCGAPH